STDLDSDISAVAHQHVNVALDRQDMDLAVARIRIWRAADLGQPRRRSQSCLRDGVGTNSIPEFVREFRIHRFRSSQRSQERDFMPVQKLAEKRMLTPKVVIYPVLRLAWNDFAVIARHCPTVRVIRDVNQICRFRVRLVQIYWI